jgi:hypothetical protein
MPVRSNVRGNLIKILWHDGIGMPLYAQRLEKAIADRWYCYHRRSKASTSCDSAAATRSTYLAKFLDPEISDRFHPRERALTSISNLPCLASISQFRSRSGAHVLWSTVPLRDRSRRNGAAARASLQPLNLGALA